GDFDADQHSGRRRVHHRDPHDPAEYPVLGAAAAGVDARGRGQGHRLDLADDLLHAFERRRLHERPPARADGERPPVPAGRDPGAVGDQHVGPAKAGALTMGSLRNIFWLGLKEIRSLVSDRTMMLFVVYAFTLAIYSQATGTSNDVN